jgi:hypothetical protein
MVLEDNKKTISELLERSEEEPKLLSLRSAGGENICEGSRHYLVQVVCIHYALMKYK